MRTVFVATLFVFAVAPTALAEDLVVGEPELVAEGFKFTEGPVWMSAGEWWFSDVQQDTIYKADNSVARKPSNNSNGLALDPDGRLVVCESAMRRVVRIEADGSTTVIADAYDGKKLGTTNDVVVRSDGTIFFTDPKPMGKDATPELDFSGVYAVADGAITLLADDIAYPNGIVLSPDAKTLYVSDTRGGAVWAFDLDGVSASNKRKFAEVRIPDGMAVDTKGNVWCTSSSGVIVFDPDGTELTRIKIPQWPANCAFGGANGKTLLVTARTRVYALKCTVSGLTTVKE